MILTSAHDQQYQTVWEEASAQVTESQLVARFIPIMGICRLQDEFRWYNKHWMSICGGRAIRATHPYLCKFEFGASYSLHPTIQVNGSPRGNDIQQNQNCLCSAALDSTTVVGCERRIGVLRLALPIIPPYGRSARMVGVYSEEAGLV